MKHVFTSLGACTPGTDRTDSPCLGGGVACAAAVKAVSKVSCLVGTETPAQMINKR